MSRVCSCGRTKAHHGRKPRVVMTSSGEVCLSRVYFRCVACGNGGFAADGRLGIHGRYSVEAERLVCLAAASWSYDVSSDRLEEFCGLKIGDTAIREISQRRGAAMNAWQGSALSCTAISGKPTGTRHKTLHRNPRLHPSRPRDSTGTIRLFTDCRTIKL